MQKCSKTILWCLCAAIILAGLGAAIYFIVNDAIDEKIKACMTKHFAENGMFQKANITIEENKKFSYSQEDCDSIVNKGRSKTNNYIDGLNTTDCMKKQFKENFLDLMLFANVLDKFGHDSSPVKGRAMKAADANCNKEKTDH